MPESLLFSTTYLRLQWPMLHLDTPAQQIHELEVKWNLLKLLKFIIKKVHTVLSNGLQCKGNWWLANLFICLNAYSLDMVLN